LFHGIPETETPEIYLLQLLTKVNDRPEKITFVGERCKIGQRNIIVELPAANIDRINEIVLETIVIIAAVIIGKTVINVIASVIF
jgi:hypothetical protein